MYYYIANPTSGSATLQAIQGRLQAKLKSLGIDGEWARTVSPGEAKDLAAAAVLNGFTTIIAVGGSGTFNEVINGVASSGSNAAVGIIPIGHQNDFAYKLGITGWQQACKVLSARKITPYKLIAAGQNYFLSALELGFEAELSKSINNQAAGLASNVKQAILGWSQASQYQKLKFIISADQAYELSGELFSLKISNLKFEMSGLDDRLMIEIMDRPSHHIETGRYLWNRFRQPENRIEKDNIICRTFADSITLTTQPISSIMVDGKVAGRTPIAIRLTDKSIKIITEKVGSELRENLGQDH